MDLLSQMGLASSVLFIAVCASMFYLDVSEKRNVLYSILEYVFIFLYFLVGATFPFAIIGFSKFFASSLVVYVILTGSVLILYKMKER